MLARSSKKISEIASLCGFNSISYFNRTFLKITGMTPSAYRKEMSLIQNYEISLKNKAFHDKAIDLDLIWLDICRLERR